jgi:hypothetical protein
MRARSLWSLVVVAAAVMLPSQAEAQPSVVPFAGPHPSSVTIRGERDQSLRFEIHAVPPDGVAVPELPALVCTEPCHVTLWPGSYRLQVAGPPGSDVRPGEIPFEIGQDSDVLVKTTSQSRRSLGLKVGIVGSSVAVAGGVVMFATGILSMGQCSTDECWNQRESLVRWTTVSLGVVLVGGTVAALGWATMLRNNAPAADVAPAGRTSVQPRLSGIGLLRTQSAWGLSASAAF